MLWNWTPYHARQELFFIYEHKLYMHKGMWMKKNAWTKKYVDEKKCMDEKNYLK